MTTTFKEGANGFYCAECRMSFAEPQATCPYCGSIVSNYEELIIKQDPPEIIIGGRWWEDQTEEDQTEEDPTNIELYQKILSFIKEREFQNENDISRTD